MYVNSLACLRVKRAKSKCYRIDRVVRHCIIFPWLFNVYMDALMKVVENGDWEDGSNRVEIAWSLECR